VRNPASVWATPKGWLLARAALATKTRLIVENENGKPDDNDGSEKYFRRK
jgi:hypothetical protein